MQIGPYQVVEEVARGGMGVVYRAQGTDGTHVALKLILAHKAADPRAQQRFQAEVNALARLRHPHVVGILAAGEHEGSPWLALEFVEGQTLEARLRGGPLPIWEALRVAQQLAQALSYVHSCGLLHRDLKPANVLLRDNQALITDFGLVLDDQSSLSRITATGVFQGTPGFWAPEQARGEVRKHGPATDVYGFGAVLYACLTGQAPVQAGSLQDLLQTIHFETTQPPRKVRPEVPKWLSDLCMRCLAVVPASRPASADEVARALVLAGGTGSEASAGVGSRKGIYAALAAVVGVAALAAVGWWATGDASQGSIVDPPALDEPLTEQPSAPSRSVETVDQAQAFLDAGFAKAKAGRYAEAIDDFDEAIELAPRYAPAYAFRGSSKAELGRHAEAIADHDKAIEVDPSYVLAYSNRGHSKTQLGRYADAIADHDKALELDPLHALTYANRAICRAQLGRHAKAIEDFDKALELNPRDAVTYADRGASKAQLGRYAEAIDDYDTALELDPRLAVAYANRGPSKAKLGRYAEAIQDYDTALELDLPPTVVDQVKGWRADAAAKLAEQSGSPPVSAEQGKPVGTFVKAGIANYNAGRYAQAIEDFDKALELDPKNARAYVRRAGCKSKLRRYAEAIDDYDKGLELNPRVALAYADRGLSKTYLGRPAEAIDDFDKALELDPKNARAYANRGSSKARLGRHAEAIEDYDKALELNPSNALGYTNRGMAKKQLRRSGEAIDDFDKALELDPRYSMAYAQRGLAKAQLGRHAEAIEDYDKALELNPRDTSAYFSRGNSQVELGHYAEAIEDFSKVLELDPRVTPAYTNRGIAKAKLGRYAEAIEDYDRALEAGLSPSNADRAKRLRAEAAAKLEGNESTRR